jgi:flagellar hook-associated protein 3 FlgL
MISMNLLSTVDRNREMLSELQLDIATTKKVRRPSDDPAAVVQVEKYNTMISRNNQYKKNITQITGFLDSSTTALDQIGDILQEAKQLAIQGASESTSPEARQSIASHVDQLIDSAVGLANSRYGDRFVFAGTLTVGTEPFTRAGDVITYNGNEKDITGQIGHKTNVIYNKTGTEVFDPAGGTDVFSELINLKQGLGSNDTDAIQSTIATIDSAFDQVTEKSTDLGVLRGRLNLTEQIIENDNLNFADFISKIQDTDVVEALVNTNILENAVTTGLKTMSQTLQVSLVDFVS